jgi:hypothetical protein
LPRRVTERNAIVDFSCNRGVTSCDHGVTGRG